MGTVEWVLVGVGGWALVLAGALAVVSGARCADRACDALRAAGDRETAILGVSCDPGGANALPLTPEMELDLLRFGLYPPFSDIDR